jgi:uncharacterized metal-binding protein YceD (DUF177 family)
MTPEWSRPFAVARVGEATRVDVEADAAERDAVAARMGLHALHALSCRFVLHRGPGQSVQAEGSLSARVEQTCVVTLEVFEALIAEEFAVRFVPEDQVSEEVDIEADDEIPYGGATIDLGEAAAEQLALALDPFPRRPGVEFLEDDDAADDGPFAALARRPRPS